MHLCDSEFGKPQGKHRHADLVHVGCAAAAVVSRVAVQELNSSHFVGETLQYSLLYIPILVTYFEFLNSNPARHPVQVLSRPSRSRALPAAREDLQKTMGFPKIGVPF